MELPLVKHWRFAFEYYYSYIFDFSGTLDFNLKSWKAITSTELRATTDGHLYPHLHDLVIEIDKSKLKHPDPVSQFFYRQYFDLGKYMFQSAYNMFGASILNRNLYTISKKVTGD